MEIRATLLILATCLVALPSAFAQRPPPSAEDVLIEADTDAFDPGLPVGAEFPSIRAVYQGQEIDNIDQFIRDKGAVFLTNRSVDW